MNKRLLKMRKAVPVVAGLLLLSSCVEGFESDEKWESSVQNTPLANPKNVVIATDPANELEMIVSWDIVPGAGGYNVAVYNVDDPENPVLLGKKDNLDGLEYRLSPITEDTKFSVDVQTLGNEAMNNTGASAPETRAWTNMLPVYKTIPTGSDLATWFAANPVPASADELCYQLEAGGEYTMTGNISFGPSDVTVRGDKVDHAKVTLTNGSFVSEGNKLRLQFMDIDASDFTGTVGSSGNALFMMSPNFPTEGLTENGYCISPGMMLQSCKVTGLKGYIFFCNQKYALTTLLFKDCIVGLNASTLGAAYIRFSAGMAQNFTITESTFYNESLTQSNNSRFIQFSTGDNFGKVGGGWLAGSGVMSVTNCTFWQMSYLSDMGNGNGPFKNNVDKVTIQRTILVNSGTASNNIWNFRLRNTNFTGGQNSQWWDGEDLYTRTGSNERDNDTNPVLGDPGLTHLGNGEFRMTGAAQLAARTGDPRWLPAVAE